MLSNYIVQNLVKVSKCHLYYVYTLFVFLSNCLRTSYLVVKAISSYFRNLVIRYKQARVSFNTYDIHNFIAFGQTLVILFFANVPEHVFY